MLLWISMRLMTSWCTFSNLDRIECAVVGIPMDFPVTFARKLRSKTRELVQVGRVGRIIDNDECHSTDNYVFSTEKCAARHLPVMLYSWRILLWMESAMWLGRVVPLAAGGWHLGTMEITANFHQNINYKHCVCLWFLSNDSSLKMSISQA